MINKIKQKLYYNNAIKSLNCRCKDCGKLITFGNHTRCIDCQRINQAKIAYNNTVTCLKNKKDFLIWFTGFWEGEGTINAYNRKFTNKTYEGYRLSVAQKEKDCLFKIKKEFNLGNVYSLGLKNVCSSWSTDNIGAIIALTESMIPLIKSTRRLKQIKNILNKSRMRFIKKSLRRKL